MHLVFFVNFLKIYLLLSFTSSPPLTSPHLPSPPLPSPPLPSYPSCFSLSSFLYTIHSFHHYLMPSLHPSFPSLHSSFLPPSSVTSLPPSISPLCFPLCLLCTLLYSLHVYIQDGRTALYIASWNGHVAVVQLLIERGAEVDVCMKV